MSYRRKSLKSILRFRRSIPPVIHHSELEPLPDFTPNLNYNLFHMKDTFADCSDIVFHSFRIGGQTEAVLIYIDGLTDTELLDQQVLTPLKESSVCDQDMEDILRHITVSSKKSVQIIDRCRRRNHSRQLCLDYRSINQGTFLRTDKMGEAVHRRTKCGIRRQRAPGRIRGIDSRQYGHASEEN